MTKNCREGGVSGMLDRSQTNGAMLWCSDLAPGWLRRSMPQSVARRLPARRVPRPHAAPVRDPVEDTEASTVPLYTAVLAWLLAMLPHAAFHRPTCKRLALLVTGLLVG